MHTPELGSQPPHHSVVSREGFLGPLEAKWINEMFHGTVDAVENVIRGKRSVVELVFAAIIAEGHVLIEDAPGTGKTTLATSLAQVIDGTSSRIQFTPDLLPSDVTGVTVFNQRETSFEFHPGPVFSNVVLADEINRASPKTQAALLEVMQERQVTVDNTTHELESPFLVIATQNPVEQAGTYPLPEAQLDRFLIRTSIGYPDQTSTLEILTQNRASRPTLHPVVNKAGIVEMQRMSQRVYMDDAVAQYAIEIVEKTRTTPYVRLGGSVRAAIALARLACVWAPTQGRHFVIPEDIRALAVPVIAHRLLLEPEAEFEGLTTTQVVEHIVSDLPIPTTSNP